MKFSDLLIGAFLILLGVGVLAYGLRCRRWPGQRYGAGAVPDPARMLLRRLRRVLALGGLARAPRAGTPLVSLADWARDPRLVGNMLLVLALIIVYVLLSERIGFFLAVARDPDDPVLAARVPLAAIAAVAVLATLFIQVAFVESSCACRCRAAPAACCGEPMEILLAACSFSSIPM